MNLRVYTTRTTTIAPQRPFNNSKKDPFDLEDKSATTKQRPLSLPRYAAKPPGCSFLGAKATQTMAKINDFESKPIPVILDSGSDITLMSEALLGNLRKVPKIRLGQRINLIQVTGKASINGFTNIDLIFDTNQGPVSLNVDAYIVKGMTMPFILGNDFADQYLISLVRRPEKIEIHFGQSRRYSEVDNTTFTGPLDSDGHTFKIHVRPDLTTRLMKIQKHRYSQKIKQKLTKKFRDQNVRAAVQTTISPFSSKLIPIHAAFIPGKENLMIERTFHTNRGQDEIYRVAESIIHSSYPEVFISNFSSTPITISLGQVIGLSKDPNNYLDKEKDYSDDEIGKLKKHAKLITTLNESESLLSHARVESIEQIGLKPNDLGKGDISIEGGPKTSETPPNEDEELLDIDICKDLSKEQQTQLHDLLFSQKEAFGTNGRLGNFSGEVEVPLKEGTKPISIPPFIASPEKREIIDKQIDAWLKLDVIEPSKSPWGAPVFIVYRNKKP